MRRVNFCRSFRKRVPKQSEGTYRDLNKNNTGKHLSTATKDINEIYQIDEVILGEGHYGVVKRARLREGSNKLFAVKIIDKRELEEKIDMVMRELNIMRDTDHPHIVQFCEIYSCNSKFYIIMEYLEGGSLKDYIKEKRLIGEREAKRLCFQMCLAINHLHEKGVAHRDLKLENFIFSDEDRTNLKLIDFGLAKNFHNESMVSYIGTPYYVSPEIIKKKKYNEKCDEWSLGVCLYKMLTGVYPFQGKTLDGLFDSISNPVLDMNFLKSHSKQCRSFITDLIVKNTKKRKSVKQLLFHPWLDEYHMQKLEKYKTVITKDMLSNIMKVSEVNQLGLHLIKIILKFFDPPSDYSNILKAFFCADNSLTGLLSDDDLLMFYKRYKQTYSVSDLKGVMRNIQLIEESFMSFTEFVIAALDRQKLFSDEHLIKSLFAFLDHNNLGRVTEPCLMEMFNRSGFEIRRTELVTLLDDMGLEAKESGFDLPMFKEFIHKAFQKNI